MKLFKGADHVERSWLLMSKQGLVSRGPTYPNSSEKGLSPMVGIIRCQVFLEPSTHILAKEGCSFCSRKAPDPEIFWASTVSKGVDNSFRILLAALASICVVNSPAMSKLLCMHPIVHDLPSKHFDFVGCQIQLQSGVSVRCSLMSKRYADRTENTPVEVPAQ